MIASSNRFKSNFSNMTTRTSVKKVAEALETELSTLGVKTDLYYLGNIFPGIGHL